MTATLPQIATLVLSDNNPEQLKEGENALGLTETKPLSPERVIEGFTTVQNSSEARDILSAAGVKADVCVQPRENRKKPVLVCDMDSTLIGQ